MKFLNSLLFLILVLGFGTHQLSAQNYSLGVDIAPLFQSDSKGAGFIFKKIGEKDNLRARIDGSFGTHKRSSENEQAFNVGLGVGYGRKKMINNFELVIGSDVVYNHSNTKAENNSAVTKTYSNLFGLAPFAGLNYIFQENFSIGVESSALISFVQGKQENPVNVSDIESIDWSGLNIDLFNSLRAYLAYRF